jgi:outer membrane protein
MSFERALLREHSCPLPTAATTPNLPTMSLPTRYAKQVIAASLVGMAQLAAHAQTSPAPADTERSDFSWALGAGGQRTPAWIGASHSRYDPLPYFDFNWRDIVDLSVTDGLSIDLLHSPSWHGGLIGTLRWGRSAHDLGALADAGVATFSNTYQAGIYLEYVPIEHLTLGANLSHDVQSTGAAYGNMYLEWEIPVPSPVEHSLKLDSEFMNRSAMQRYFGVPSGPASALGVPVYQPSAGASGTTLSYEAFIPTSRSTGFALGLYWTRLASEPAASPLVQNFGSRTQRTFFLAFAVHG